MLRQIAIGALKATQFVLEASIAESENDDPYIYLSDEVRIEAHKRDGKYVVYTEEAQYNQSTGRYDYYVPVFVGAYNTREEAEDNARSLFYHIA